MLSVKLPVSAKAARRVHHVLPSGASSVNVTVPTSPPGLPVNVAVSLSVTVSPTVALLGEAVVVSVGVTSVMVTCSLLLLPSSVIGPLL